ncbi:hypothetical protein YC2023_015218 [Brassica napus]
MHATKVSHICPFVDIFWTQEDLFKKNNDSTFCRSLTISTLDKQEQNDIRSIYFYDPFREDELENSTKAKIMFPSDPPVSFLACNDECVGSGNYFTNPRLAFPNESDKQN